MGNFSLFISPFHGSIILTFLLIIAIFFFLTPVLTDTYVGNITQLNETRYFPSRQSRGLIFEGGGVAKMIFGFLYPIRLEDKVKWRQLNCAYNLQAQYSVPTEPVYWWEKWDGRTLRSMREQFDKDGTYVLDESRLFVYATMESYMNQQGKNGRQCVCRSICENAQVDQSVGMFSEMLHAILLPGKGYMIEEYTDAYEAGRAGVDCVSTYPKCPPGDGLLDPLTVTFSNFD